MNFEVIVENLPKLLDGALLTVELVVFSSLAGLALAFPLALARCSPRPWLRAGLTPRPPVLPPSIGVISPSTKGER
ncbi:MAG: hypothetical protein HQL40_15995 [Alphaproteobacteria bacterium]|nr:hypothetical protein [Alphaproteobacteria bacterium]